MEKVISRATNNDVRKLSENKWQITGKSTAEIKAASDNCDAAKKEAVKIVRDAHNAMWALINKKTGTSNDDSLHIDIEHMKESIIFLIRENENKNIISGLLRKFMESHDE